MSRSLCDAVSDAAQQHPRTHGKVSETSRRRASLCRLHRTTDSLLVAVAEVDDAVSAPDRAIESNERRRLSGLADRSIGQKQRKIPLLLLRISFLPLLPPLLRCPLASLCVYSLARISRVVVSLSG